MVELWVLEPIFPGTNMVDLKKYGLEQSMGFDKYGLFQSRLYKLYTNLFMYILHILKKNEKLVLVYLNKIKKE